MGPTLVAVGEVRVRPSNTVKPIFYDAGGRRRRIASGLALIAAAVLGSLAVFLLATTLEGPILPALNVASPSQPLLAAHAPVAARSQTEIDPSRVRVVDARAATDTARYGHLVNWDENSFASLKRNAGALDAVILEWLHLGAGGRLIHDNPQKEAEVNRWHKMNAPTLKLFVLIDNYVPDRGQWDAAGAIKMLAYRPWRANLMRELFRYVSARGFAGVVLDFRELPFQSKADLTAFTGEMANLFNRRGMQVMVSLPVEDCRCDYRGLAGAADAIILRTYDMTGDAGAEPVADQGWFEERLDTLFRDVSAHKLIVGIGAYGYDRVGPGKAREISVQEAWQLAQQSGATLRIDRTTLNPGFTYFDRANDKIHTVWFLDGVTAHNQVAAALAMRPAGLALRRLGAEDSTVWGSFARGRAADAQARKVLMTLRPGYGVLYRGEGEVHRLEGEEKAGKREIVFDTRSNLVTNEKIATFPASAIVTRTGGKAEKTLALTFDDGPDRTYTPQILDILAEKRVKATFFIVGTAANANTDLLARIYREGHDIGNHTFTHVNSAEVSAAHLRFEINATQRLIEATTGVQTKLFRAPYAENMEPSTIDGAEVLRLAASLGYLTVGMSIDPKDWMRPLPAQIVKSTVQAARAGSGHIVLLHDAGGVRTATVRALPEIIDQLRADGFEFVTVHELLGLRRDEVMRPVTNDDSLVANVNHSTFILFGGTRSLLAMLFWLAIALGSTRLVLVAVFAIVHSRREEERFDDAWVPPSFVVVMPAYNEERVICGSIRALLASDLEDFRIIVVDDGSADRTSEVVRREFGETGRVTVITKPNGGKSTALNEALNLSNADVIVTLDADTIFEPDALRLIVRHFADSSVGAVAGAAVVGNQINLITRFQALEYVTNQNLDRRALEVVNGITVVPGAIGAWRRQALLAIGGFCSDTLAEDADATIRLEIAGWRVICEPRAVARTEAPETLRAFLKQRLRWMFGMLQVAWKNRAALLRCRPLGVALFGLPNILVFQYFFILIAPVIDIMLIASVATALTTGATAGLWSIAAYWASFQMLDTAISAVAISLDARRDLWHLLPLLLIQRCCYRQLLYLTAIRVMAAALSGRMLTWGKLVRTGTVIQGRR